MERCWWRYSMVETGFRGILELREDGSLWARAGQSVAELSWLGKFESADDVEAVMATRHGWRIESRLEVA